MSSIAELLKEFSTESSQEEVRRENIEEGQVGAEELTVVTDETTTELEEAIEEVAEAVEDQEQVAETTETLLDAAESLENAVAQIEELRLSGQRVNAVSMKIWARGVADSMEARQIPAEVYKGLMDDFGTSFESTDTYSDYSAEAEEKGEGIMTKIWNMIKAAFAKARDFLARLIGWFGKSADVIIKAGYKLQKAAKDKKELRDSSAKVNSKPYVDLVKGGSLNPVGVIEDLSKTFADADKEATLGYDMAIAGGEALKAGRDVDQSAFEKRTESLTGIDGQVIGASKISIKGKTGGRWYNEGKLSMKIESKPVENVTAPAVSTPMSLSDINSVASGLISFGNEVKKAMVDAKRTEGKLKIDFPKDDDGKQALKFKERRVAARTISSSVAISGKLRSTIASKCLNVAKKAYVYSMANVRLYK